MTEQNKYFRSTHIVFLLALFGMILLIIAASYTKTHDYVDRTAPDYTEISDSFHLTPDGSEVIDFSHLGQYISPDGRTLILYCRLPELTKDSTLIYRSKGIP